MLAVDSCVRPVEIATLKDLTVGGPVVRTVGFKVLVAMIGLVVAAIVVVEC